MSKSVLVKNIFSVGIIQVVNYLFPLITIPIVTRIIGPDKFGVLNFTTAFVAYFVLLIGYGFDLTATRRIAADPDNVDKRSKVFSEVFSTQCLLMLVSIVFFVIVMLFVPQFREERLVAAFTFITCFATLMTQNWLFQAMQDLPKIAILNMISKVLFTTVIVLTIREKSDYIWIPLIISSIDLTIATASFIWAIYKYKLKLYVSKLRFCLELLWEEKIYFFSLCVISLYSNTNIIVLGMVQKPEEVGYYTAGLKLILIVKALVFLPLAQAVFPYMGKAFGESFQKGITIAQKLIPVILSLTLFIGFGILISSPLFIGFLYGEAFTPAIEVCRVLSFIPMLVALNTVLGIHLMMNLKMDKQFFRIICLSAVVGIPLNYYLVRSYGYMGPAYTLVFIEVLNFVSLYAILKSRGIEIFNGSYFKPSYFYKMLQMLQRRAMAKYNAYLIG
ncbi:oligosaccharide flippase family protein [Pontibacter populi]|uniref:Oligosaccharide flippase family protein n=1 Tax=Pontibacter populi TaxID=890055 RepID=A0ABV1RX49_9BACT